MDILGIGLPELVFILAIMLVVLGPRDMVKTGRQIGLFIRRVIQSPIWNQVVSTSQEIRDLPTRLVRESGFEEEAEALRKVTDFRIEPPISGSIYPAQPGRTVRPSPQRPPGGSPPESALPPDDPGPQI